MDSDVPSTSEIKPIESLHEDVEMIEDDDEDDTNGVLHGVDVMPHLEHLENDLEENEYNEFEMGRDPHENVELVQAINRFMRNECNYDEFMRITGGQTLQEELGVRGGLQRDEEQGEGGEGEDVEDVLLGEEETEDEEDAELIEEDQNHATRAPTGMPDRYDALPEVARNLMAQVMFVEQTQGGLTHEPITNIAEALKSQYDTTPEETPPLKQVKVEMMEGDGPSSSSAAPDSSASGGGESRDRGKSKRLDALLGQANVLAARGNITDAMELLREVIRQDHKHAMAYQQIATVYEQEGDHQKALQFGLLASHLDPRTPAEDWMHWGDEAKKFGMYEEAAVCYDRAVHLNNENWKYYERRIEMLDQLELRPLAMRTRLQAAQMINHQLLDVDFQWFHDLIRQVAQYYITMNDEEKAILALEAFVLRSKEFGENAEAQHETLVGMHLAKCKYQLAGKSIISLCKGIRAVYRETNEPGCQISYTNGTYECVPFPPLGKIEYEVDTELFPVSMHCHLVICLFALSEFDQSLDLEEKLLKRTFDSADEHYLLEVARAYKNRGNPRSAVRYLTELCANASYQWEESGEYWYLQGSIELMQKNDELAMAAFEKVLILLPNHIDNRINLSALQQKAGLFDKALETLRDFDLENCSSMPDERLLARQADVLFEAGDTDQFVKTTRMLLSPHFYQVYTAPESLKKRRVPKGKVGTPALSNTLRTCALNVIKHTNWERLVKRLGATVEASGAPPPSLSATALHDYCLKLIESLNQMEKHHDALIVCCYAFLHPLLFKQNKTSTFQSLVYFCAIKARCWNLAFEYVRFFYTFALANIKTVPENIAYVDMLHKRLFNAMNYVFVNSQNVCYHRFIMRALVKSKDNHALQAISGNNSLITGTYRHAMGEYLKVWMNNKRNPLICLLLALTFTHMSCKKDLSSRHLISIRGIAFMKKYSKARTCHQEVYYNTARMFHQMSVLPLAKYFYDKVLEEEPPNVFAFDDDGNEVLVPAVKYDLRKLAAHNLALIYRTSGNHFAAREIYEKYLIV